MIDLKIKNGVKKVNVKVPYTQKDREYLENRLKNVEFEISLLERDIKIIGDKETLKFAEKRLEDLKAIREAISTVLDLMDENSGGETC